MLPHRAHEGASAQGVLEQREERGWDALEHRRSLFPDPPLLPGAASPRAPTALARRRARKQSVHIIAVARPRLSMLEKVPCASRHLLNQGLFSAPSPVLCWGRSYRGVGGGRRDRYSDLWRHMLGSSRVFLAGARAPSLPYPPREKDQLLASPSPDIIPGPGAGALASPLRFQLSSTLSVFRPQRPNLSSFTLGLYCQL